MCRLKAYRTTYSRLAEYLHMTYFYSLRSLTSVCCPRVNVGCRTARVVLVRSCATFVYFWYVRVLTRFVVTADLQSGPPIIWPWVPFVQHWCVQTSLKLSGPIGDPRRRNQTRGSAGRSYSPSATVWDDCKKQFITFCLYVLFVYLTAVIYLLYDIELIEIIEIALFIWLLS